MKKKITALCLCVALLAIAVVGASLAYFTDTKTAENTFTVGNVQIKLDEANVNDPTGDRVTSNEYTGVTPGLTYAKDPIVHNTGDNDAWIRMTITVDNGMNWLGLFTETKFDNPGTEAVFNAFINNTLGDKWSLEKISFVYNKTTQQTDLVYVLKYAEKLSAGADTTAAFEEIMFPPKATAKDITTRVNQNGTFYVNVVAEAIQADTFDTWEAAFAAFDAQG